jgi:hypothetical protein
LFQELEDGEALSVYACRLGPVESCEGPSFVYLGLTEASPLEPAWARSDAEGLAALKAQVPEQPLLCEPDLSRTGQKLGFRPERMPHWAAVPRATFAFVLGAGELLPEGESPSLVPFFLQAAARYAAAKPWQWWTDCSVIQLDLRSCSRQRYEGVVMGAAGELFGFALYEGEGGADSFLRAHHEAAAHDMPPAYVVTLDRSPPWAAEAIRDAYGTCVFPLPAQVTSSRSPVDDEALRYLTAVMDVVSSLGPDRLTTDAMRCYGGKRVLVSARAPAPDRRA